MESRRHRVTGMGALVLGAVVAITGCGTANPELQAYRERFTSVMTSYLVAPAKGCAEESAPGVSSDIAWYPWSDRWVEEFQVRLNGHLLVLNNDNDLGARGGHERSDELQVSADNLWLQSNDSSLFASDPGEVTTVAQVVLWDREVGQYTDGSGAWETSAYVTLVNVREVCSWPELKIAGGSAPRTKVGSSTGWGEPPEVLDRLVGLPREP